MRKIAIDVTSVLASRTGVGVSIAEIVKAMIRLSEAGAASIPAHFKLCALSTNREAPQRLSEALSCPTGEFRIRRIPIRILRPLIDRYPWPSVESLFGDADVFHASHLLIPASRKIPVIVTVHDLTPIRFPEYHLASNTFTRAIIGRWLERVIRVIVPSESTARDLQEFVGCPKEKVSVVPMGVSRGFHPLPSTAGEDVSRLGLEGDFILTVGSLEPRKNLPRLLQAFRLLKDERRIPHKLAIVGPRGWMEEEVYRRVRDLGLENEVVFTGFVGEESLNLLYNKASLLAYPSLYEGFGLPPLEAMAAGCPVAVSRISSIPEVVGEAGRYFDPLEVEDIARAIFEVLDSDPLRQEMIRSGFERSRVYTWERTARETLHLYRWAIESR